MQVSSRLAKQFKIGDLEKFGIRRKISNLNGDIA